MTEKEFLAALSQEQQDLISKIRKWIATHDGVVKASVGEMMGQTMLMFNVAGECKYGFTVGKYVSFHNIAMYCNPEIRERYAFLLGVPKSRVQKSCINLSPNDTLDETAFANLIKASAQCDWPVK